MVNSRYFKGLYRFEFPYCVNLGMFVRGCKGSIRKLFDVNNLSKK